MAGGLNLYGYGVGDPINNSDPFGLCPRSAGGDGKTLDYRDCPEGTEGAEYYAHATQRFVDPEFARETGPNWEATMRKSADWIGCRQRQISFGAPDKSGRLAKWTLKRGAVVTPPNVRGIPLSKIQIGFYFGTFTSSSYDAPLAAAGQIFCKVGVGTFEAGGYVP